MEQSSVGRPHTLYLAMLVVLITGATSGLLLKYQVKQEAPLAPGQTAASFYNPWLQGFFMMVGEFLCLLVYLCVRTKEDRDLEKKVPKWVFVTPTICDVIAASLFCCGIAFIAISVAQICRSTMTIFTCAIGVLYLGKTMKQSEHRGIILVTLGTIVVSLSMSLAAHREQPGAHYQAIAGILFCISSQFFQALMYIGEEQILNRYGVQPLLIVGMEGLFGIPITIALLFSLWHVGLVDTPGSVFQILNSPGLAWSISAYVLSAAAFNFAGVIVTREAGAVSRTVLRTASTLLVWMVELALGWNTFNLGQLAGFSFVILGTLVFNEVMSLPDVSSNSSAERTSITKKVRRGEIGSYSV